MRLFRLFTTAAAVAALSVAPAAAQGKSGSAPKGGWPKTNSAGPANSGQSTTVSGNNGRGAGAGHTTPHGNGNAGSNSGKGAAQSAAKKPSNPGAGRGNKPSTTTATGPSTTTTVAPPNALSTKLSRNPNQLARMKTMLPEGMTLEAATAGFRNQGQFIAALNASKNQHLPFADLQTAMTVDGLSLGQAVRQVRLAQPPTTPTTPTTGTTTGTGSTTGTGTTTASN